MNMTDEEWREHWWDIAMASIPKGLTPARQEAWMVLATFNLTTWDTGCLREDRELYLRLAKANGWRLK